MTILTPQPIFSRIDPVLADAVALYKQVIIQYEEYMGAKSDVAVKLVLVFFIALLSFSIGTYIGKKYSDNQHKLAQLEPEKKSSDRQVASENSSEHTSEHGAEASGHEAAKDEHNEMLSDDEIKKLAKEEFIADDKPAKTDYAAHNENAAHEANTTHKENAVSGDHGAHEGNSVHDAHAAAHDSHQAESKGKESGHKEGATAKEEKSKDEKAEHHEPSHAKATSHTEATHDKQLEAAQAFLDGKIPEPKAEAVKTEKRMPTSLPKDISQYALGKFTVQVASYATKEEAQKRADKLTSHGYQANVFPAQVGDKTWYRVSFGLYGTTQEAQAEKGKYLEKFAGESALVQKIK